MRSVRQENAGGGVSGDGNGQPERIAFVCPCAPDGADGGVPYGAGVAKDAARRRADGEFAVCKMDAADAAE